MNILVNAGFDKDQGRRTTEIRGLRGGPSIFSAAARNDLLYAIWPKHHVFWHWCQKVLWQHPRLGCTHQDEDFVGRVKTIVGRSCTGLRLHQIPRTVALKVRWGKEMLLTFPEH